MPHSAHPPVLVCAHQVGPLAELRRALEGGGYEVAGHLLGVPGPDEPPACALVVLDGSGPSGGALEACSGLRARFGEGCVPILFVTDHPRPGCPPAAFEARAAACLLRPFSPGELLGQVGALLRRKESHDRLSAKAAEAHRINTRLQQAYQQMDEELELAQRLQVSF